MSMPPAVLPTAAPLLHALAMAGTWASPADLQVALNWPLPRVRQEIAAALQAGDIEANERMGTVRLVGTPLSRQALRRLLQWAAREEQQAAAEGRAATVERLEIVGRQAKAPNQGAYCMGVAKRVLLDGQPLVTHAQIDVPYPKGGSPDDIQAFQDRLLRSIGKSAAALALPQAHCDIT